MELVQICNGKIKISQGNINANIEIFNFLPFPTSVFEIYMN